MRTVHHPSCCSRLAVALLCRLKDGILALVLDKAAAPADEAECDPAVAATWVQAQLIGAPTTLSSKCSRHRPPTLSEPQPTCCLPRACCRRPNTSAPQQRQAVPAQYSHCDPLTTPPQGQRSQPPMRLGYSRHSNRSTFHRWPSQSHHCTWRHRTCRSQTLERSYTQPRFACSRANYGHIPTRQETFPQAPNP